MKTSLSPLGNSVAAIHGGVPADLQAFHESFEEFEVDDVVFHD